ncbi:cytochrome c oxidase assembly factor CtaG [Sporosarcina sp. P21c]|uniref:cytochrome c oxidase assembly factor CtaG n=1 Tax=Sporosarcina TaxID=1569 RepID=UPI000A15BA9F|nr:MULTISPECIES: cytochrome c oxidase assembly factor CtaG [Sporosarcina]ARJ39931.1 cytochrome c oxidase assembly factor CtaG [Sporosarcina ureae]PIC66501.1 cytochrome c oxidase assembly factor CtaG [Sporosarcina sp. P16a]PIC84356.1 cytochrome c oxidase assembly factor CtaG [Sporosarcina sp. P1]PIC90007.1 cytochrome c oxidase assembly factor CtaG [Sporosarcina sp. P21c]PIC93201.1 cytochrome c oxidase assembly factor CtaG [Sporosarcina sp. P25]
MPLSIFGFRALWSPYFLIAIALGIVLYYLVTVKWRDRFEGSQPLTKTQAVYFLTSMVLLYIVKGSPMDLIGHILFSVHMAQMAILLLIVAPFFIIGIPNWVWERLLSFTIFKKIFMLLTKPLVSLLLFTFMFSMYHYPLILDQVKLSLPLHTIFTITLFFSAICLWWPVVNTVKGQPQLHGLKKIGYVILSALLITPACSLIIFVDVPVYETYSSGEAWLQAMALCVPSGTLAGLSGLGISGPELFTNMPTLYDQQLGGILMKVIQEIVYVVIIGRIFLSWSQYEKDNADEITRQDLLERHNLTMHG